ncbi:MAG: histidine phosphatase family protein [Pseudomonadota bacterium]
MLKTLAISVLWLCSVACASTVNANTSDESLWHALKTKHHVALMRHALAPGTGDPANFDIAKRSTQRNLSDVGRAQATSIGDRFRQYGIAEAEVYSSLWFRCMETAELLDLGEVTALPALNSFFQDFSQRTTRTDALKAWLLAAALDTPRVLVTHQVNITALTGVYPTSGEIVVLRVDPATGVQVLGSIEPD